MQAVVYHADSHFAWGPKVGDTYKRLFAQFVPMCHRFGMDVIHLTLDGHPGWGDLNIFYGGLDRHNVMLNREEAFCRFLDTADDAVYWFSEPDYRIHQMWPELTADLAMLYRHGDSVPLTPAWRMGTRRARPLFERARDHMRHMTERPGVGRDWHGDSEAWNKIWRELGSPHVGTLRGFGVDIELRPYPEYIKGKPTMYGMNYLGKRKFKLLDHGPG